MKFGLLLITIFAALLEAASAEAPAVTSPAPVSTPVTAAPKVVEFNLVKIPEGYFNEALTQAKADLQEGREKEAEKLIRKEIKNTTRRSPLQKAYILDGLLHYQNKRFREAIKSYERYLKLHAANSDVLFLKGLAEIKSGDLEAALQSLHESAWFNKYAFLSAAEANIQISNIFLAQGNKLKANEFLTKALSVKADSPEALNLLAEVELSEGKKPEAEANLRKALAADPENDKSRLLLARTLLTDVNRQNNQKDIAEAKTLAKTVLDKNSEETAQSAAALLIRANIEETKFDDAGELLKTYLKIYPQNSELLSLNQQLRIEREGQKASSTPEAGNG